MPDQQVKLDNVRLSFPDIWTPKAVNQGDEPKFGAAFLLDKEQHAEQIKELKVALWSMAMESFGGKDKAKALIDKGKLHLCLHEGDSKDYDGYTKDNMYISSSSKRRPTIIDRDKTALAEADGRPYAGCYVNAVIRLWVQDNQFGKRINAELMGIQFVKDGDPFGAAPLSDDAFDNLDPEKEKGDKSEKKGKGRSTAEPEHEGPSEDEIPF